MEFTNKMKRNVLAPVMAFSIGLTAFAPFLPTQTAYAMEQNVKTAKYTVTADGLNVRAQANTTSKVLGILKKGSKVDVIKVEGKWATIAYEKNVGYVSVDFIKKDGEVVKPPTTPTEKTTTYKVTATVLNVRAANNTNAKVLGMVKKDEKVQVVKIEGKWATIQYKSGIGYVSAEFITKDGEVVKPPTKPIEVNTALTVYKVSADVLNIRSKPSTTSPIIGTLKQNDQIELLRFEQGKWGVISRGKEIVGYVSLDHVMKMPSIVNVKIKGNLHTGPKETDKVLTSVAPNEKVTIMGWKRDDKGLYSQDWVFVSYQGFKGYVKTSNLDVKL